MFLLIRQVLALYPDAKIVFKFLYVSINSTVGFEEGEAPPGFKFHYVSINSCAKSFIFCSILSFKFHYVSINSLMQVVVDPVVRTLNSIMFLLIPSLRFRLLCR